MTDEERYELLKATMVKAYTAYIRDVEASTFAGLQSHIGHIQASDKYMQAVKAGVAFYDFVKEYRKSKKEPN